MSLAKGAFVVHAGVVPGKADPEFDLVLPYTSEQYETDRARAQHDMTTFAQLRDQALEQARQIADPDRVNWVRFEFVWY